MPPPVTFTTRLKLSDLYRCQLWFSLRGSKAVWGMLAIMILLAVNTYRWDTQKGEPLTSNFGYVYWLGFLWIAILVVLPAFQLRSKFKTQKILREEVRYSLSDKEIELESPTASARYDWSHVLRVVETKAYFYFFMSNAPSLIIPKRSISEPTQIADLRGIIQSYVKGKLRLLS